MPDPSDAPEREPYRRTLAAILEVAQVLLTLQTAATLDAKNMLGLVVENITTLLDDLQHGQHTPERLHNLATARAQIRSGPVAYRRLDEPMGRVEDAFRGLTVAKLDALAVRTRSDLYHAISSAKEAFRQLANSDGSPNPDLLVAITRMSLAIRVSSGEFASLGHEHTIGSVRNAAPRKPVVSAPYERPVSPPTRSVRRGPGRDMSRAIDPFDR